jgi:hypothetical protein
MGLITLVYISYATDNLTDDQLKVILNTARTANQKLDVTGMLLYRDKFFIQALEGEEEVVDKLYAKISQDPRHRNILTVYKVPITERVFKDWKMGFNKLDDTAPEELDGYSDFLNKPSVSYFTQKPSRASILLESFRMRSAF